ncbi:hypothetical protein FA13DRAFT_154336 [Coprinellus micaceus]|uniref:DUF7918 domain-containing protein n=1 Tax=Coprinellus micaceus TaxID=71717 RepID=A0A4Y7THQ7_COPMI|nr:hypothetical protein FA13DRAFT_154336 [Coprinellus micaceus]
MHYRVALCLDGKTISSGKALERRIIKKADGCTASTPRYFEGQREENGLRPFKFASVRLTDDDSHMTDVSKLGDLVVTVFAYKDTKTERVRTSKQKSTKAAPQASLGDTVVHERAKKGLTSCVQFGELRAQPGSSTRKGKPKTTKTVAINVTELGRITFKYRQMGEYLRFSHLA